MRASPPALVALAALAVLAGCGPPEVEGDPQLTVYLSAPLSGPRADDGQDVADAAELALADAGGEAGGTAVVLEVRDDATAEGWDAAAAGANARLATQDSTAIAYVGDLDSGASRTSIPITNEAGILQVSPGSGAEDLTRDDLGSSGIPGVQAAGERTFGRVIPSDRAQGEGAAVWMSELGITSVEVVALDEPFGAALVSGLEAAVAGPAIVGSSQSPEATYVARANLSSEGMNVIPSGSRPVFGSDALLEPSGDEAVLDGKDQVRILAEICRTRTDCPERPRPLRLTSAALDPSQLPPAADAFLTDFSEAYDRVPGPYAAYGYEAMALALDSINRAEDPLDRSSVVAAFFAIEDRESILGTYSIDAVGDTTLPLLGAYEAEEAGPLEPAPEPLELP